MENKNNLNHMRDDYGQRLEPRTPSPLDSGSVNSNPVKGLIAAIFLGIISAIIWAVVVKVTGYNLGVAAIAVGFLVSQGFVWAGKGDSAVWGVIAAIIATLSILIGNLLTVIIFASEYYEITFFQMLQVIDIGGLFTYMIQTFEAFDLVFYAIALQTAYKRSFIPASKNYADYLGPNPTKTSNTSDSNGADFDEGEQEPKKPMATPESEAR